MKGLTSTAVENFTDYFPLGLAKGKSFCNRIEEQRILRGYIDTTSPIVLFSPRRYGKSSLAIKVIENSKLPYEIIDLFIAKNAKTIEKYILSGVERLINKVITIPEQLIKFAKTALKNLDVKLIAGTNGISIEFSSSFNDSAANILEALKTLDKILMQNKQRAILFIDEFQQIGSLAKDAGIEGALRHVAQQTQYIAFIFSGSNRHLLTQMFDDSNRPFYNLCHKIQLQRIDVKDYIKYLNNIGQKAWGDALSDEVLMEIFNCTERHPYYMNVLCGRIWINSKKPTKESVRQTWEEYIFEERSRVINELNNLTTNQYLVLNKIAHGQKDQLTGHIFLSEMKIPSSSMIQTLNYLEKYDYIYEENNEYLLIDPLIKSSLLFFSKE